MLQAIKNLFKKKEQVGQLKIKEPGFYNIGDVELKWAVKQINFNKKRYMNVVGHEWMDFAVLHYIVNRLNYAKLHLIVPRSLDAYRNHYYYQAAMKLREELQRTEDSGGN